jgi:carotenoid cleavage dioxygenase
VKVQIHESFVSKLPQDDSHPYRSGAWRPQTNEYDAWNLDVQGEIPRDLAGTYLRNTENPLLASPERYHPFDGDGMLHSISFAGGEARYHNRFVKTDGFLAERKTNEPLYAGFTEFQRQQMLNQPSNINLWPNMKDASSTDVVVHRGQALTSFWLCGDLYAFDPVSLESQGKADFGGKFPADGVSAHTKIDENSGEMLFFNYGLDAPYMHYGEIDVEGNIAHYRDVLLEGPRMPHDMAFTENYAIVNAPSLFFDPKMLEAGVQLPRFFRDVPMRFGIIPRRGKGAVRWFEAQPTFVLHWINAYEEGDEIILDGFFQEDPMPAGDPDWTLDQKVLNNTLDLHALKAYPHRWRFNMQTGTTKEERLSDRIQEFGMINGKFGGRRNRFSYNALPCKGWFGFAGIIKQDLQTGAEQVVQLPAGVFASETVMAPRRGSTAEDDGYLITFTMDLNNDRSQCLILDAQNPTEEPLAVVTLPERISSGTHAFWHPAAG